MGGARTPARAIPAPCGASGVVRVPHHQPDHALEEDVYVTSTGYAGIAVGGNSIVRGSTVILSNASGVSLAAIVTLGGGFGSSITNNVVSSNTNAGIYASAGTMVAGNTVRSNSGVGLWLENGAAYRNNVLSGNASGGPQVSGGLQMGPNVCNTALC